VTLDALDDQALVLGADGTHELVHVLADNVVHSDDNVECGGAHRCVTVRHLRCDRLDRLGYTKGPGGTYTMAVVDG
jgi:hypothetical protein